MQNPQPSPSVSVNGANESQGENKYGFSGRGQFPVGSPICVSDEDVDSAIDSAGRAAFRLSDAVSKKSFTESWIGAVQLKRSAPETIRSHQGVFFSESQSSTKNVTRIAAPKISNTQIIVRTTLESSPLAVNFELIELQNTT